MTNSPERETSSGQSALKAIIEAAGGVEYMRAMLENHEALGMIFQDAYASLLQEHPDQWVAWGKDGTVGVSDSQEDLLRKMRAANLMAKEVVIEYLDTKPRPLIL